MRNLIPHITRRQALQGITATRMGAGLAQPLAAQTPAAAKPAPPQVPQPSFPKPSLHVYAELRLAARLQRRALVGRADRGGLVELRRREVPRGGGPGRDGPRQLHPPVDRVHRLDGRPRQGHGQLPGRGAAIGQAGMKTMPCLFNRWHDHRWDYGGTYTEDLLPRLAAAARIRPRAGHAAGRRRRVLMWDLCNEPQAHDLNTDVNKKEFAWLEPVAETVRACGAQAADHHRHDDRRQHRRPSPRCATCSAAIPTPTRAANWPA